MPWALFTRYSQLCGDEVSMIQFQRVGDGADIFDLLMRSFVAGRGYLEETLHKRDSLLPPRHFIEAPPHTVIVRVPNRPMHTHLGDQFGFVCRDLPMLLQGPRHRLLLLFRHILIHARDLGQQSGAQAELASFVFRNIQRLPTCRGFSGKLVVDGVLDVVLNAVLSTLGLGGTRTPCQGTSQQALEVSKQPRRLVLNRILDLLQRLGFSCRDFTVT